MISPVRKKFDPLPVIPEEIPRGLQSINRFVVWRAFASDKPDGQAAKIPVDIISRQKVSAFDAKYQMTFDETVEAYEANRGDGIGIVLDGQPVATAEDGSGLYLVGIDLDDVFRNEETRAAAMEVVAEVASYAEISPSGRGFRIFCVSKHKPRSGQTKFGEIYAGGRFLTVTGHRIGFGKIVDATKAVRAIDERWWARPTAGNAEVIPFPDKMLEINRRLSEGSWTEVDENIDRLREALRFIPPEGPYETWRNVVWAVASLGWECGQQLAEEWSEGSEAHWERDAGRETCRAIASLFDSFDAGRGISLGTLFHHAYANGMSRPVPQTGPHMPSPPRPAKCFDLLSRDDLDALPPLQWTVRGVLPETGLASIFGDPGSGKSFLALDLAARISFGLPDWFGRPENGGAKLGHGSGGIILLRAA